MLNELRLEGNRLRLIPSNEFSKLISLRILHLEQNQISSLKLNAFNGLRRLIELHLNDNQISFSTPNQMHHSLIDGQTDQIIKKEILNELRKSIDFSINEQSTPSPSTPTSSDEDYLNENVKAIHLIINFNELKYLDLSSNPLFLLDDFNSPFSISSQINTNSYKKSIQTMPTKSSSSSSSSSSLSPISSVNSSNNNQSQLETLLLTNCSIFEIKLNAFNQLNNLVNLNLNHNLIYVSLDQFFLREPKKLINSLF